MARRRRPKRNQSRKPAAGAVGRTPSQPEAESRAPADELQLGADGRNAALDTLRGLAILLMIVDHIADIWLDIRISGSPLRFATRLSMPLFCVLMGYFFEPAKCYRFKRLGQIVLAALAANLVFWPYYQRIEILGSLLIAYGLFIASGRFFPLFVFAILFYPLDGSTMVFDFPITIVLSFVAQGMVLRRMGIVPALVTGVLLASGALWIHEINPRSVSYLLCFFILPATILVWLGGQSPEKRIPPLDLAGRHPLTVYVAQYYVIMLVYVAFLR